MRNRFFIFVLLPLLFLAGCATNPVTGKNELSLISEANELDIGVRQYAPLRQSQGGDYNVDPGVQAYVAQVGKKLAAVSDRPLPYEFSVINNSVPNAWALPGGKISINRGLLTELKSEAELAAVLGHEITHAAAKHSVQSMSRGMLLQGAMLATVVATQGKEYAQLAQIGAGLGAQLINTRYGRDAERESDYYGMLYMSRAGYDPQGAVDLQKTFVRLADNRQHDWLSGLFASHPPSQERVNNNLKTLQSLPQGGERGEARYQQAIAALIKSKPAYEAYDEGRKALAEGKNKTAMRLAKKAIATEPGEAQFHALLGDIEKKKNRLEKARRHYDKALSLNDQFFYYHLQRGLVNQQLKTYGQAASDLQNSAKLLPTASAYNALGDVSRSLGKRQQAKTYYAKAAKNDDKAGKRAYASLVRMDLAENPAKYIKVRVGKASNGRSVVEISNPTPVNVTGLVLEVRVPDNKGQLRKFKNNMNGILAASSKEILDLKLGNLSDVQLQGLQAGILQARVAQ